MRKYILFVSDFGQNSKNIFIQKIIIKIFKNNKKLQNRINKTCLDQFNEFNKVSDLFLDLDKDSSIPMIIIRPHPSEDHEPWERISKKLKKFKVVLEGEISPWINGSKAILHRGCSTSIQAYLGDIPQGYIVTNKKKIRKSTTLQSFRETFFFQRCKKNFVKMYLVRKNNKSKNSLRKNLEQIIHIEKKYASEIIINDIIKMNPLKRIFINPTLLHFKKLD